MKYLLNIIIASSLVINLIFNNAFASSTKSGSWESSDDNGVKLLSSYNRNIPSFMMFIYNKNSNIFISGVSFKEPSPFSFIHQRQEMTCYFKIDNSTYKKIDCEGVPDYAKGIFTVLFNWKYNDFESFFYLCRKGHNLKISVNTVNLDFSLNGFTAASNHFLEVKPRKSSPAPKKRTKKDDADDAKYFE